MTYLQNGILMMIWCASMYNMTMVVLVAVVVIWVMTMNLFLFFLWYWSLNSGPCALAKQAFLSLEP
jgi:hypothetical protein